MFLQCTTRTNQHVNQDLGENGYRSRLLKMMWVGDENCYYTNSGLVMSFGAMHFAKKVGQGGSLV